MTRRSFFGKAGGLSALAIFPHAAAEEAARSLSSVRPSSEAASEALHRTVQGEVEPWPGGEVGNAAFRLTLSPREGLRKTRVLHVPSGLPLADADYSYSFGRPDFHESRLAQSVEGSSEVSLRGSVLGGQLEILHQFRVPHGKPWMEEEITLANRGSVSLDLSSERCGFVLPLPLSQGEVSGKWRELRFTAIPYRREPGGHRSQYADFSLAQILTQPYFSELWTYETTPTPAYASEGWVWTDGRQGFLITKYSQQGMEWALLDRVQVEGDQSGLRWGGYGIYRGNPERGAWLSPGESHRFGVTRLTAFPGGMVEGFYAFREEMAERGHGCPQGFNPPVHWNELYDNKLWWLPGVDQDDPENRKKYYTLADMKEEAAKARAIGAEALYMDPGWDTNFASKVWDESRLGSYKSFTEMLRRDYGLKSSLHTPLSGWCNPSSYPPEMYRLDRFGRRLRWEKAWGAGASPLCGVSYGYLEETARRLKALAREGAAYFMFDGTAYHGPCWDPQHGHRVPAEREEHVQGLCRLARMVHAEYPQVLIEMHDPVVGGTTIRYTPTYYGHGRAPEGEAFSRALGFDSVWAFELMWMPMEDLLSGRAIALYYYNLAYALPLYIHIDLRTDNQNALVFWWNASTCRHLGIGGTPKDAAVQKAHREAMATYRRLEPFFKAGAFYGVDETVHVHVHPTEQAAVINCFNLEERLARREVEFIPGKYGLDAKRAFTFTGVPAREMASGYTLIFDVPARGHRLAEVRAA
jgi:hypothetical protein